MARWQFVAATAAGEPVADLLGARSRKVTFRRDGPCEASWSMDGRWSAITGNPPDAAVVKELLNDVLVYRDGDLLFRGRIGPTEDTVDADSHTVSMAAVDYRGYLDRRILYAAQTYTATDQAGIAWALVDYANTRIGGDVGITRGTGQTTGVNRDRNYEAGKSIGEALDELGRVIGGFDWEVDPWLRLNVYSPSRGTIRDFVAEYGSNVARVSRSVDPGSYANAVRSTGDTALTTAVTLNAATLATRPERRFDLAVSDPDVKVQQTVQDRASAALAIAEVIQPSYTVTLRPGRWSPGDVWLGDVTKIVVRSGRLDVNTSERVEEISVSVGDDGSETVELTYGNRRRESLARYLRYVGRRLVNLERR